MSATLHMMPGTQATVTPLSQPREEQAPRVAAAHPLVQELRRAAWNGLEASLQRMSDEAPTILEQIADEASAETLRSACYECMRVLPMLQAGLTRALERELDRGLSPLFSGARGSGTNLELGRMALLPTEDLEESVALARMASRARAQFAWMLTDIESRIGALARSAFLPLSPKAFSPAALCDMFRAALDAQDLEFTQRDLMLRLFERSVLARLDGLYGSLSAVLDQMRVMAPAQRPAPVVDEPMLRALQDMDGLNSTAAFSDSLLAAEVLGMIRGKGSAGTDALRQRAALVGQMFAEILADPYLPASYLALLERLRFPTLKTALADSSFFTNPAHPVRWLVQDAVQMAVSARLSGDAALHYTGDRLARLPEEFNISAAFVQPALRNLEALSDEQAAEFLDSVRTESAARWSDLLTKSRRIVSQELETQLLGNATDPGKSRQLRSALAPLLAAALLRHGMNSRAWVEAVGLVSAALDQPGASAPPAGDRKTSGDLLGKLEKGLREAGLSDDRLEAVISNLRQSWGTRHLPEADRAAAIPAAAPVVTPPLAMPTVANDPLAAGSAATDRSELCRSLLKPESWYRVFDSGNGESKWLKLVSYYPERRRVAFCGFSADNQLSISVETLMDDFKSGRSEPISPSSDMLDALRKLRGT